MKYILDHTVLLNNYRWDILMLIVTLVAMISLFFYCRKKIKDMKKEKEELEDKLSAFDAQEDVDNADNEPAPEIAEDSEDEPKAKD